VRVGSRAGEPPFAWEERATWEPALDGARAVYLAFAPDLAIPGAAETVGAFARLAAEAGVRKIVLLSGRGEEGARRAEREVQTSGAEWTVLRASWFFQNFTENFMLGQVLDGEVAFPAGETAEPFVDCDDIADAAVAALTEGGHAGRVYELTGPRLLTFRDAAREISAVSGREVRYLSVTAEQFADGLAEHMPAEEAAGMAGLFAELLDGRNARVAEGVREALGRAPRDFADFARAAAASGVWSV
jgi:uncharacterized protein YbjT (DUF2867 family)